MARSAKQQVILDLLQQDPNKGWSLQEMLDMRPQLRTFNRSKQYLGQTIKILIARGLIERASRGVYKIKGQ